MGNQELPVGKHWFHPWAACAQMATHWQLLQLPMGCFSCRSSPWVISFTVVPVRNRLFKHALVPPNYQTCIAFALEENYVVPSWTIRYRCKWIESLGGRSHNYNFKRKCRNFLLPWENGPLPWSVALLPIQGSKAVTPSKTSNQVPETNRGSCIHCRLSEGNTAQWPQRKWSKSAN